MSHFSEKVAKYKGLMEKGAFLQVIDKYYDEAIKQKENSEPSVKGRATLREMEVKNLDGVHTVELEITSMIVDEEQEMVMGEMLIRFHSKKHGWKKLEEAFVQKWEGGKIVYQRFYYHAIENL